MEIKIVINQRRTVKRLRAKLPVIMLPESYNNTFSSIEYSDTLTINTSGMSVPINKKMSKLDASVRISLFVPPKNKNEEFKLITLKGCIVRLSKIKNSRGYKDYIAGFEFSHMNQEKIETLQNYIDNFPNLN